MISLVTSLASADFTGVPPSTLVEVFKHGPITKEPTSDRHLAVRHSVSQQASVGESAPGFSTSVNKRLTHGL